MRRFGVTCASLPDLVSRVAPHMPADCSACGSSSVVSVVAPTLPLLPILAGKFIERSDMPFRSPYRPHRDIASMVSGSDHLRSTDVYSCDLDATASTPGSNDSIGSVRVVSGWLRRAGAF